MCVCFWCYFWCGFLIWEWLCGVCVSVGVCVAVGVGFGVRVGVMRVWLWF